MAKVFLKSADGTTADNITLVTAAEVFGTVGGNENVYIANLTNLSATAEIMMDANIEGFALAGAPSDYLFSASGNVVTIYKAGTPAVAVATVVVQDDNNGTGIKFVPATGTPTVFALTMAAKTGGFDVKLDAQVLTTTAAAFVPDTTAPTVTALTQTGKTLTITAEAGSTLTILDGTTDVTAKFTVTESSGTFTAVANVGAFNGTETLSLSAKATDTAGNVGTAFATPVTGAIDTTAPAAPTFALATDSGTNTGDGITNVGTVNVTGLEVGATWEYSTNGGTDWSAGTGTSFTLAEANYVIDAVKVRQSDAVGNVSTPASNAAAITVDTTAPAAPSFELATDSGTNTGDGITNVGTVNVTGLETGATWVYSTNGGTDWSAGAGTSFTLAEGTYAIGSIQVKQTDAAGNAQTVAAATNAVAITVDTTAPTVTALTQTGKTLTITAEAGSTLTILDGTTDVTAKFTVTESSGTFTAVANVGAFNGTETLSLSAKATDTAGNVGTAFATPVTGAIDTTAPAAPTFALATDSGTNTGDGITNVGTVNVTGLEVGATWEYSTNGGTDWSAGTGTSFTLAEANYVIDAVKVRQSDAVGNVSTPASNAAAITVDTTAPAAPSFELATDSGTNTGDGITNVGTVNVTGLETGATWVYSTNGGSTWSAAQAATTTSFTLTEATYAIGSIQVKQTDAAGNAQTVAAASNAAAITVDTTAPAAATTAVTYTDGGVESTNFGVGDTITLNFSELLASITGVTVNDGGNTSTNTHITGAASFVLDAPASTASVVLDSTSTLAATDTITLVGVDLVGNSASMIFTLA